VTLVQAVAQLGSSSATTFAGALKVDSNPAQTPEDSATFGTGAAVGAYGTGWRSHWGTAQVSPSVTLATRPIMLVGRRGSQAAEAHCCGKRIAVEYVAGGASGSGRQMLMGVG